MVREQEYVSVASFLRQTTYILSGPRRPGEKTEPLDLSRCGLPNRRAVAGTLHPIGGPSEARKTA